MQRATHLTHILQHLRDTQKCVMSLPNLEARKLWKLAPKLSKLACMFSFDYVFLNPTAVAGQAALALHCKYLPIVMSGRVIPVQSSATVGRDFSSSVFRGAGLGRPELRTFVRLTESSRLVMSPPRYAPVKQRCLLSPPGPSEVEDARPSRHQAVTAPTLNTPRTCGTLRRRTRVGAFVLTPKLLPTSKPHAFRPHFCNYPHLPGAKLCQT